MINRKILILTIFLLIFATVCDVSASCNDTQASLGIDDAQNETVTLDDSSAVLTDDTNSSGNFNDLSALIENTTEGSTLKLEKDYKNMGRFRSIPINKTMTIDGQGHIIDSNYASRIFFITSDVVLKNIIFTNSKFDGLGGAIYISENSTSAIFNSTFINCSGEFGGALYFGENSISQIIDSNFINCFGEFGGAVYFDEGSTSVISDSNFRNNVARIIGGGFMAKGKNTISVYKTNFTNSSATHESGGAFAIINSDLKAQYLQMINCTSVYGGAITSLSSNANITHSNFRKNSAAYDGGAIFAMYNQIYLDDNNFSDNFAKRGGALYVSQADNTLIDNHFTENSASLGNSIYSMSSNDVSIEGNVGLFSEEIYRALNNDLTVTSLDCNRFVLVNVEYGELPGYYSLIDEDCLTPVKDQGDEGNCWAFTVMGALESCIKKASGVTFDLSEANLKNIMALYSDYGCNVSTNGGGNFEMAFGYLASWLGPIFEEDDFYSINDYLSPILSSVFHVQNIIFLKRDNYTDNDDIKYAVLNYGAVCTSMNYDSDYMNSTSYFYNGMDSSNHAVSIVGWNDTYSRFNFKDVPEGDGAWIVRNSWGPTWGDNGYFYVSYYDRKFAEINSTESCTFILNDTVNLNRNYQYEIRHTSSYTYGVSNQSRYKNVFTVKGDEYLAAVSTYFLDECDYNLTVYVNDILTASKLGKARHGYFTIYLENMTFLEKDDNVSVVFVCGNFSNGVARIPCSTKALNNNLVIHEGVSYFWDVNKWVDFKSLDGVACIKMFTTFSSESKVTPYFDIDSQKDEDGYLLNVIIQNDATGLVSFTNAENTYVINLSETRSIKLCGLDESNCTFLVNYSGDGKYLAKAFSYTVDITSATGTFDDLRYEIENFEGDVLTLEKDYVYVSGGTDGIYIADTIVIDGNGHTISGNNLASIFNVFANSTVLKNIRFTAAAYEFGAAIYIGAVNCTIINCSFTGTTASKYGAAIYVYSNQARIINSSFANNSAGYGAAVYVSGNGTVIDGCSFVNNSASMYGGAVYLRGRDGVLSNSIFEANNASLGGSVLWNGINGTLINSTFVNTFNDYPLFWNSNQSGNIISCIFLNGTKNIKNPGNAGIVKRQMNLICANSSFEYGHPDDFSLYSDEPYDIEVTLTLKSAGFMDSFGCHLSDISQIRSRLAMLDVGTWNLTVEFRGDDTYDSFERTFELNVSPAVSALDVSCENVTLGHECEIMADVVDGYNCTVNEGTVIFYDNETEIGQSHVKNGTASLKYEPLEAGEHIIRAVFSCDNYISSNDCVKLFVDSVSIGILAQSGTVGFNSTISVTVKGMYCNISEGSVSLYVDNEFITTKSIDNGHAVFVYRPATSKNHEIRVKFTDNGKFTDKEASMVFAVEKADCDVSVNPVNGTLHKDILLVADVVGSNDLVINDGNVTFMDGDTVIGTVKVVNGRATCAYTPQSPGKHNIAALYRGDNYLNSNGAAEVYVDCVEILAGSLEGTTGFNSTLTVMFKGLYSNVSDGSVTFYINNNFIGRSNIVNGNASISYVPLSVGIHTLKIVYTESQRFSDCESFMNYTVNPAQSSIKIDDICECTFGDNVTLTAVVSSPNNLTISDGLVMFYDDGRFIGLCDVKNAKANLTYVASKSGNHTISAEFVSDNYNLSTDSIIFSVAKVKTHISLNIGNVYYDTPFSLLVDVLSDTGPVGEGSVKVYVNGREIKEFDVVKNRISVEYKPDSLELLNFNVTFAETGNYLSSNASVITAVKRLPTVLESKGVSSVYGVVKYLTVTLKDNNGKALTSKKVSLNLNGVKNYVTDSNGRIKVSTNGLVPKTYSVKVSYNENGNYAVSTKTVKIVISRATPKLTAAKKTFKRKVKIKKYTITLKTNKNKAMSKVKVTLKVNGKTYAVKTKANGKATFNIKNLKKKGKFTAIVTFNENKYYNKVVRKVKITVK